MRNKSTQIFVSISFEAKFSKLSLHTERGTPLLITLHPLFQRQRRVIRIHAETVDHLAWHRQSFFLMGSLSPHISGFRAKSVHQLLIWRFMDVPMQHVGQRCSICPTPKLAVIAEYRIVHQHYFSLIVMDLRIILDSLKLGYVKLLVP